MCMLHGVAESDGSSEVKPDIPVFLAKEADSAVLLVHPLLRNFAVDYVCAGSTATGVGGVLHSSSYVFHEYSAVTEVVPIFDPLSTV